MSRQKKLRDRLTHLTYEAHKISLELEESRKGSARQHKRNVRDAKIKVRRAETARLRSEQAKAERERAEQANSAAN